MNIGAPANWLMGDVMFTSPVFWWIAVGLVILGAGVIAAIHAATGDEEAWSLMILVLVAALLWPLAALVVIYLGPLVLACWGVGWVAYRGTQEVMRARGTLPTPERVVEREEERYRTWAD